VAHLADGPADLSVGGPDVLTRREMAGLAFEVLGREPRIGSVPPGVARAVTPVVRLIHPRLGDLIEFATAVSTHERRGPLCRGADAPGLFEHRRRMGPVTHRDDTVAPA
jgi:hypothetical protein